MTSRNRWKSVAAASLCSLALAGCKQADTTPQVQVTVQAAKPAVAPISEQIQGDAILSPLAEAALSPKISAPVKTFYVQRGAHVHAGQLLVTLEDRDLQAAALDNQGAYTAAQATYQQATGVQLPAATQAAQLDLAQAQANLELNQSIVKARSQLFQEGAIPGRDLDTAKAALVQAQAAYDTAAQHLQALEKVGRAAGGQVAQGDLTSAKGKYLNAEALASYASLRSPIDGVVTDRPLFAGEMAPAGTPLITVMDTTSLIAKLHLSQAVTQRMKVGDKAEVNVPGMSDPIEGSVSLISPALDPGSTTVEVWVKLRNPDGQLRAGTPVHVAIVGRTVPNALQVPSSALITSDDGSLGVMIVGSDSTAHLKPVTVGIRLPDTVQILSGVGPDDVVIDSGGYGLQDGTKVKIGAADDDKSDAGDTKSEAGDTKTEGKD
jgi:multidrug efflux pump subunit AcrA (membrane-fusion protein)